MKVNTDAPFHKHLISVHIAGRDLWQNEFIFAIFNNNFVILKNKKCWFLGVMYGRHNNSPGFILCTPFWRFQRSNFWAETYFWKGFFWEQNQFLCTNPSWKRKKKTSTILYKKTGLKMDRSWTFNERAFTPLHLRGNAFSEINAIDGRFVCCTIWRFRLSWR